MILLCSGGKLKFSKTMEKCSCFLQELLFEDTSRLPVDPNISHLMILAENQSRKGLTGCLLKVSLMLSASS